MGAEADGCRQMGADADGCRCRWVHMQMGALMQMGARDNPTFSPNLPHFFPYFSRAYMRIYALNIKMHSFFAYTCIGICINMHKSYQCIHEHMYA
jgi:hypothetical protein